MGFLKEALKVICVENQWSYAVFWKIGCRNPTLLVWEECHYEPARYSSLLGISGFENTEALLKEWEELGGSSETQLSWLGCQVEDRVCSLIKMMMNSQVHVVGQGIVGRAAFTGSHLWILKENLMGESHPSEVVTEVNHQFSAGMQTVAVIPVLPHGVIQLASTLAIMENIGFVNNVKSLFAQERSVPGVLLSHNYLKKDTSERIGLPLSAEQTISKMERVTPLTGNSHNQQILRSRVSGFAHQSSHSLITPIQDNVQNGVSALQTTPGVAPSTSASHNDHFQSKAQPVVKLNFPVGCQQVTASMDSEGFPSSSSGQFEPRSSRHDVSSGFSNQFTVDQSSETFTGLKLMEQRILSGNRLQGSVNNIIPASNSTKTEGRATKAGLPKYFKDSIIASLLGGKELPNAGGDHQTLSSFPRSPTMQCGSADGNIGFLPQEGVVPHANSSNSKVVSLFNHSNQSSSSDLLRSCSQSHFFTDEEHTRTDFSAREHRVEDLLQAALNIPSGHQYDNISGSGTMSATIQNFPMTSQEFERGSTAMRHVPEDPRVGHSSGEDLFDILGLDFKSKLLCGTGSDVLMHGTDATLPNLGKDVSTCLTQLDSGLVLHAINDGISGSGIFSEAVTDHLLDAVVSKAHSTSNQNSGDSVSCKTTVTRMSSSSIISDAPTYDHVSVFDQMKVDTGLRPPSKVKIEKSSSFKSGSGMDNVGGPQINPVYRSQISLWMEDGHNVKQENSISTANSKRLDESAKTNRKRLRPGESPRPRPKDRQMIQDRVKELREIVPNGAKCSIDALLERTIKHMLFLQSVTKHADKLKQSGESKIISKEGRFLLKDNFEGGATWAYEVGSQSMIYPIVVEDLNTPRQMLVEMLCEERGFFLEIADIIRGLGLTILKGIMESRNDKVWAHFAVEANRDVSRMDIFLSLVHLLEKAGMGNSTTLKGIDSSNLIVHNNFNQASIPATGPCNSLQ